MREALAIGSCLIAPSLPIETASAQHSPPNILLVLADNIGVDGGGELHGSPTPRIDRLAAEGLRLTQFLVEPSWKQFRAYFADVAPGRIGLGGATLLGGEGSSAAPMNGHQKVFNMESDPSEEHNIDEMHNWVLGTVLKNGGGIQGEPRAVTQSARREHDEVLNVNTF
ncbi:hypothetical protein [Ensifer adhaerens]|uniref:hypothetical protein n=1 Tax=Ensifer adhaerens TaxID=106592 RepID=UPI001569205D|nr:hypothetical protein [Ensifer adhaerens]